VNASISADPYNGWAYRNKAIYYLKKSAWDDAIRLLQRAEESDPTIENLQSYLGDAFMGKKDKAKACEHYQRALALKEMLPADVNRLCR
ncbi:MAG: tetratricopeptide repeat protein, partial [Bacteroidota bacterium]